SASGPSRSSNAPLTLLAFNCCRAAGSSNEPWPGSIETAAWQRISKHRLRPPRRVSTSPLYSSSSGDWLDPYAMYLRYNTTIPIKIQTLKGLYWDGSGMCLFAKRLERHKFVWPPIVDGTLTLTPAQLALLV